MKTWIIKSAITLLLILITGLGAAAATCSTCPTYPMESIENSLPCLIGSRENSSLAGFLLWEESDTYFQMREDEDSIAAEKFLFEKIKEEHAILFKKGEKVYVAERSDKYAKVRIAGEDLLWTTSSDIVVCP